MTPRSASIVLVFVLGFVATATATATAHPHASITKARGGLDHDDIHEVIDRWSPFDHCNSSILLAGGQLDASATFTVTTRGRVRRVRLAGAPEQSRSCLARALRWMRFPARKRATTVTLAIFTGHGRSSNALAVVDVSSLAADDSPAIATTPANVWDVTIVDGFGAGPLSIDVVARKVESAYTIGLRRCFQTAHDADRGVDRDVTVTLTIGLDGGVTEASAGTRGDAARCITRAVRRWRFPYSRPSPTRIVMVLAFVPTE